MDDERTSVWRVVGTLDGMAVDSTGAAVATGADATDEATGAAEVAAGTAADEEATGAGAAAPDPPTVKSTHDS